MRRNRVDSGLERQFLTAMIVSDEFLNSCRRVLDLSLFERGLFKQISRWCVNHYDKYKKAPGKDIQSIYMNWADRDPDGEHVEAVRDFLEYLSANYDTEKDINAPFLLDRFNEFLTKKKLLSFQEETRRLIDNDQMDEALAAIYRFQRSEIGAKAGVDANHDDEAWEQAFEDRLSPIINFPGDAGRFLNAALTRDALIGIQAPEKRGKTWWCIEFLMQALKNRKKVAFFQVGDLSQRQVLHRLGVRLTGRPIRNMEEPISYPKKFLIRGDHAEIEYTTSEDTRRITKNSVMAAVDRFFRSCGIPNDETYLMIGVHPISTINVKGIESILEKWVSEKNFVPDVIIIDYADILVPEDASKQLRDQINDTWMALRRLSQERHCLVITPTQANAASYNIPVQTMENFSNDKRKLSHVTGMLGLNQMNNEKQIKVMRLNWIVLRESDFSAMTCLTAGYCFSLGRAMCCSTLQKMKKQNNSDGDEGTSNDNKRKKE